MVYCSAVTSSGRVRKYISGLKRGISKTAQNAKALQHLRYEQATGLLMTRDGRTQQLWHVTQLGHLAPTSPVHAHLYALASASNRGQGCLYPLQPITILFPCRDLHMAEVQNNCFLPLKERKGYPKCHILWLLANFKWQPGPKAIVSLPTLPKT